MWRMRSSKRVLVRSDYVGERSMQLPIPTSSPLIKCTTCATWPNLPQGSTTLQQRSWKWRARLVDTMPPWISLCHYLPLITDSMKVVASWDQGQRLVQSLWGRLQKMLGSWTQKEDFEDGSKAGSAKQNMTAASDATRAGHVTSQRRRSSTRRIRSTL